MSPAEAAERLFNRVMAAYENGDIAQAQQFAPMALDAYAQLGPLDNDGHYHVGLIHITLGDTQSAQAELEAIQSSVPEHLLGLMLEHSIAEANEDAEETTRVYTSFLAAYDDEISVGRDEYLGHRNGIDGFRARAFDAVAEP